MKKCGQQDLSQRLLEKWNDEVQIMAKISHDNIVKALPTPPQLVAKANEPTPLVMEYCSGGDLRNVSKHNILLYYCSIYLFM